MKEMIFSRGREVTRTLPLSSRSDNVIEDNNVYGINYEIANGSPIDFKEGIYQGCGTVDDTLTAIFKLPRNFSTFTVKFKLNGDLNENDRHGYLFGSFISLSDDLRVFGVEFMAGFSLR